VTVNKPARIYGLDVLRVLACYMVIQIHAGEFYYINSTGEVIHGNNAYWVGWYNSLCRASVPLFVMISGFFLFPIKDTGYFYKKRFTRVVIPFVVWCILYAFYQFFMGQVNLGTALINILKIPVNFGTEIGHLWYVYILIGLYLLAPIIAPWIETASRKNMELYLSLWAVSLSLPYIHLVFPEVLGEAYWNKTPALYYFSGFLGYAVLANYIKRYFMQPQKWNYLVGLLLIIMGYAITTFGYIHLLPIEKYVINLELTWGFESINVAMMAAGLFLVIKNVKPAKTFNFNNLLLDISAKSYGIYLVHIMVLNAYYLLINGLFLSAAIKVPVIALLTFITSYIIIRLISYLPKSKNILMF